MRLSTKWALMSLALACSSLHAALFEDEEARRAILELRQRVETLRQAQQAGDQNLQKSIEQATQVQKSAEQEVNQYKQSLLQLQSQIDSLKQDISSACPRRTHTAQGLWINVFRDVAEQLAQGTE